MPKSSKNNRSPSIPDQLDEPRREVTIHENNGSISIGSGSSDNQSRKKKLSKK